MTDKNEKSPATTSDAYDRMCSKWQLMHTILEGTPAMRIAGELYAPMHPDETPKGYQNRLQGSVLFNMVEQTLDTLSGKPFSDPIKLSEDIPTQIQETVLDNVDLQGNNIDVFSRHWFRDGMTNAFSHVLVDMPRPTPREDGNPRTVQDDLVEGVRPYWTHVPPQCLLFAHAEMIDGKEVLQHVRIQEFYTEMVGFAEVEKTQIRILEPGKVSIYHPVPEREDEWILHDDWETGLDYIPLVTFYANKKGFMLGKPPLEDLAHLNVTHWQSTSDQRHILTVARFPILACDGEGDGADDITIGPNKILYSTGKKYYLEHKGTAIEAGRKDLEDLERQMQGYGSEFLKEKTVQQTATERRIDSAEASSDLSAMCVMFEDAMMQVLNITADWMRLSVPGGEIEVVKNFQVEETDPAVLEFMKYLRENNDLSRDKLIAYAKLKGFLPEDFDVEADWEQIVEEVGQRSELLGDSFINLDPDQDPDNDDDVGDE